MLEVWRSERERRFDREPARWDGWIRGFVQPPYRGLEQAADSEDLACLNGDMLVILWPGLFLPKGARRAGEDEHATLRSAARSA